MQNLRVLEFGSYLAAPLVGKYMASLGCQVTCVVRPDEARGAIDEREWRQAFWHDMKQGKQIIQLDLVHEVDKRDSLLRDADVILVNFGVGVAARLGIDADRCREVNPNAMHVNIPGFASEEEATTGDTRAWDSVVMASSGVFCDMGLNRTLLGIKASFTSLPQPSVYASFFAILAIMAAYHDDRRSERIEIPLGSALLEALVHNSIEFPQDSIYQNERQRRVTSGAYPISPLQLEELLDPFFQIYTCGDGRPFYLVCPSHARHQRRALHILRIEEEALKILPIAEPYACPGTRGIGSGCIDAEQAQRLRPIMKDAFASESSWFWENAFGKHGVPGIAVKTTDEWTQTAHAVESGLVARRPDGKLHLSPPMWLVNPMTTSRALQPAKLADMRVIDMTNVIAGPTIGALLARFGCDVIKIDPVQPTYSPEIAVIYGLAANCGKRSVLLNVETKAGRAALLRLLASAEILIVNCTADALARLRLTREDVRLANPDIVLMRFDAWGGPNERGPYTSFLGYDDNIQAGIGIMARFGGGLDRAEEHAHVGTIDVIAGVASAAGVVAALCERKLRGVVFEVRASLASVGQYVQYPLMFREPSTLGRGLSCIGEHAMHRCYKCRDGWIIATAVLDARGADRWLQIARRALRIIENDNFEDAIASHTKQSACVALRRVGIGAAELRRTEDLKKNPGRAASLRGGTIQYVIDDAHPIGSLIMAGPVAMRSTQINMALCPAPKYGEHTIEVLSDVHAMRAFIAGAAATSWSHTYVPFQRQCDACGKSGSASVVLVCRDTVCHDCLRTGKKWRCPVCSHPHDLDIERLRRNRQTFVEHYSNWRRGAVRGATDRCHPAFCAVENGMRRVYSSPAVICVKEHCQLTSVASLFSRSTCGSR